jgi:hypothetical protein
MRRDPRVVAPHFLQQDLARHRALPGAVEIAQNRGLLLGQPDLVAFGIDEKLRARAERVGPDGEDGVFAGFVLTQLRPDAREEHGESKRLADIIVGTRLETQDCVGVGVVPGEHDDRRFEPVLAQDAHDFAAVDVGQPDIHDDEIDVTVLGSLHALGSGVGRFRLELFVQCELLDEGIGKLCIVVDDQDLAGIAHGTAPCGEPPKRHCAK